MPLYGPVSQAKALANQGRDNMPAKHKEGLQRTTGFVMLRTDQLHIGMRVQTPLGLLPIVQCYYANERYGYSWYRLVLQYKRTTIGAATFGFTEWSIYKAF